MKPNASCVLANLIREIERSSLEVRANVVYLPLAICTRRRNSMKRDASGLFAYSIRKTAQGRVRSVSKWPSRDIVVYLSLTIHTYRRNSTRRGPAMHSRAWYLTRIKRGLPGADNSYLYRVSKERDITAFVPVHWHLLSVISQLGV